MGLSDIGLGAVLQPSGALEFRVFSAHAQHIELCVFRVPKGERELLRIPLRGGSDGVWSAELTKDCLDGLDVESVVYYGYRAFGRNWRHETDWSPGSPRGFQVDVDEHGHRFNPNKLLIDPYTTELSHDPAVALTYADPNACEDAYYGGVSRCEDTGPIAPKSMAFRRKDAVVLNHPRPRRALRDDVIYEVHVRGFTMLDESLPQRERGTFRGAGKKAAYLKALGVTAVEFLPVQEFADEQNDDGDPRGDNYWGYMPLAFFAPNRRYAADKSAGGPTREFMEMVDAFHAEGIKVFLDVVYNHTGEGLLKRAVQSLASVKTADIESAIRSDALSRGDDRLQDSSSACLLSLAGLDNASYYLLRDRGSRYCGEGGCGANLNYEAPIVIRLIVESLRYWAEVMGVDGFRFDLAPILGTVLRNGVAGFDGSSPLLRAITAQLPARAGGVHGVDLIAEPWGGPACEARDFPPEWAVWNKDFRDVVAMAENGASALPISRLATAVGGSSDQIQKAPWNSINYVVSHDDCNALLNLMSYDSFFHLTDAREHWDQHGWGRYGIEEWQHKAVRNVFALIMLSAGVPMFAGGDEILRTLPPYRDGVGRMNLVGVDAPMAYLDWSAYGPWAQASDEASRQALIQKHPQLQMLTFVSRLIHFRHDQPCLRRTSYFTGQVSPRSGLRDIAWHDRFGGELSGKQWDQRDFVAYRIDADPDDTGRSVASIYVAYNRSPQPIDVSLAPPRDGFRYYRLLDTDNTGGWMTEHCNFDGGATLLEATYRLHERSILVAIEKPTRDLRAGHMLKSNLAG